MTSPTLEDMEDLEWAMRKVWELFRPVRHVPGAFLQLKFPQMLCQYHRDRQLIEVFYAPELGQTPIKSFSYCCPLSHDSYLPSKPKPFSQSFTAARHLRKLLLLDELANVRG